FYVRVSLGSEICPVKNPRVRARPKDGRVACPNVRVIVILVNGRDNGGRIDERIAELSAAEEQIVVPPEPTDSEGRQDGQFAVAREDEIIDPFVGIELAAIMGERHKLFGPLCIGKVPWLRDIDIPSAAGHQKLPLAD